jgi:hypothetical protein
MVTTDSEGKKHVKTKFNGIFGEIQCLKNIKTDLKISLNKRNLTPIFNEKTKIEMDSTEFEKYFDINTGNRLIAMQILTADLMQLMIDFIKQSNIYYEINIKNNQMYIRFHTGEVFETKMFKKSMDKDMIKKHYDIIEFIFKVIREIKHITSNKGEVAQQFWRPRHRRNYSLSTVVSLYCQSYSILAICIQKITDCLCTSARDS